MNFFDSVEHLEPHCRKCDTVIEWGTSTEYNEEFQSHICLSCGAVL